MTNDAASRLWAGLDAKRSSRPIDQTAILEVIREQSLEIDWASLQSVLERLGPRGGELYCPPILVEVARQFATGLDPKSILDPWCGAGGLLVPLAEALGAEARGIHPNEDAIGLADSIATKASVSWEAADPMSALAETKQRYDLVVSFPPMGMSRAPVELDLAGEAVTVRDEFAGQLLLRAVSLLSENGTGLFFLSPSFGAPARRPGRARELLSQFGLFLDAYIGLPEGVLEPITRIAPILAVIRRGASEDVFVGNWREDKKSQKALMDNWRGKKPGKTVASGAVVESASFGGLPALAANERIERLARSMGVLRVPLADVCDEMVFLRPSKESDFEERPNAVYLPLIGKGPAVSSASEHRMKAQNYAQLLLDLERVNPEYLAGLLNTPLGMALRESGMSGVHIPKLTRTALRSMDVFLPELSVQEQIVRTGMQIRNLTSELNELEDQLWSQPRRLDEVASSLERVNKEERFPDWLDSLPFPLASILWTYHASSESFEKRCDSLLHFFEALAEFTATVLLSGFQRDSEFVNDRASDLGDFMRKQGLSIERSSFGTWVSIVERLAKWGRSIQGEGQDGVDRVRRIFCAEDDRILELLFSSTIVSILKETNSLRNSWKGHGGVVGAPEAERRHLALAEHLARYRTATGNRWNDYQLVRPRDAKFSDGRFEYSVERVMGSRTPFEIAELSVSEPLEDDVLHLSASGVSKALRVLPLFKVMPSPSTAQNACYFYNRTEGERLRFVSYHFEAEAEVVDAFSDVREALRILD